MGSRRSEGVGGAAFRGRGTDPHRDRTPPLRVRSGAGAPGRRYGECSSPGARHTARSALVATIALLSVNPLAAFVLGFLPMLACGWQLERALRRFGRHSAEQVAATFRNATAGERRLRMVDDDGPDD